MNTVGTVARVSVLGGRLAAVSLLKAPPRAMFRTFAPKCSSSVKTPIQQWGWQYLLRQKALNRPLSPHLTVYKPMLTWMVSGLHRISGVVMGSAICLLSITLAVAPFDFPQLIAWIRSLGIPAPLVYAIKWIIVWPIAFHALNGLRFLAFDMALGTNIAMVYKTGWLVVALSVMIATVLAAYRPAGDLKEVEEQK